MSDSLCLEIAGEFPDAARRKSPKLREKNRYFVTDIYRPDGRRTTVNFGPVPAGSAEAADVYDAFARWLRLFESNPHKCLSFTSPWDAIESMSMALDIQSFGDLIEAYLNHAEATFKLTRKGDINPHFQRLEKVLEFMEPYIQWPVNKFGPNDALKVRQAMIDYRYTRGKEERLRQLTRKSINEQFKQLFKMFNWGVGRRAVEPATEQALKNEVRSLPIGHPGTVEGERRSKVTDEDLGKVIAVVNDVVAAMLQVLRHSISRPTEVTLIRPCDISRVDPACWLYIPGSDVNPLGDHKMLNAGDGEGMYRVIPFTQTVQQIIQPWIDATDSDDQYIFQPKVAVRRQIEKRRDARKTPLSCGNRPGTNRREHPMITPGDCYSRNSFYGAVQRACKRAKVKPFSL